MARKASRTTPNFVSQAIRGVDFERAHSSVVLGEDVRGRRRGFTIVELLIVVVVIAILAAITIVAYNGITNRSKAAAASTAAEQAAKKVMTYAVTNSDNYPASLSDAGITDGSATYQYRVDNSANPKTFCLTATTQNTSAYVSSTNATPTSGVCAGHAASGQTLVTNLALDPRATGSVTSEWAGRYGTTVSFVSGASDGPSPVTSSYVRQTYFTASSGGGRGVDVHSNLDTASTPGTALPVTTGVPVSASMYIRSSVSNSSVYLECRIHDGSGNWLVARGATPSGVNYVANTWTRVNQDITPTVSGYLACTARFQANVTWPVGSTIDATGLMVSAASSLPVYSDGATSGWAWNGTPNNSTSTGPAL
ncbi:hypothetical protein BGO17_04060 [Candidatus Saccharibacteria bacterium 49-20]|nr:MAG: hypothetical protein BGO17_04060 [Candidatus Saccharibacteria bacterium 49-20]